jgi:hypothetical protein
MIDIKEFTYIVNLIWSKYTMISNLNLNLPENVNFPKARLYYLDF